MIVRKMTGWVLALAAGTILAGNASAFGKKKACDTGCDTTPVATCAPATMLVTTTEYRKVPVEKMVTVRTMKMVPVKETKEVTTYSKKMVTEQVPVTRCVDNGHAECQDVVVRTRTRRVPVTTVDACGKCVTTCEKVCEPVVRTQKVWVPNVTKETVMATKSRCVMVPEKKMVEVTTCKCVVEEKQVMVTSYQCVPVSVTREVACDTGRKKLCR